MKNLKIFFLLIVCMSTVWNEICAEKRGAHRDTINIENEAVRYVMSLSNSDFRVTDGKLPQKFYDEARSYRPDQPVGKTIAFSAPVTVANAKVYAANNKKMKNADFIGEFKLANGYGQCELKNLVPQQTYYYKVVSDKGRTIAKGSFLVSGQVRMIAIDGGFNIRDLGGWKGLDNHTVRYEQIYRGGSLGGTDKDGMRSQISDADKSELYRIGIRAQLDLRAKTDGGLYRGEGSLHSYSMGATPLLKADFNNTMTDNGAYNKDQSVISDVAWIIYELRRGRPVYFNCRQGADRTGTVAFLIEGLLGCYDHQNGSGGNQMAIDYELTGFSQANLIDNWKVATSCRPAAEAYNNTHKLFRQLMELKASEPGIELATLQQKCYYYLNRYSGKWHGDIKHIDSSDIDWFIMHMLGMNAQTYAKFKPAWASKGNNLKETAEACATVVTYCE